MSNSSSGKTIQISGLEGLPNLLLPNKGREKYTKTGRGMERLEGEVEMKRIKELKVNGLVVFVDL